MEEKVEESEEKKVSRRKLRVRGKRGERKVEYFPITRAGIACNSICIDNG